MYVSTNWSVYFWNPASVLLKPLASPTEAKVAPRLLKEPSCNKLARRGTSPKHTTGNHKSAATFITIISTKQSQMLGKRAV